MATKGAEPREIVQDATRQDELKPVSAVPESKKSEKVPVTASLSAYYAGEVKPAAFVKAVRTEKIRSFKSEDISKAAQGLSETDPDLMRTTALLGKGSDAVARWVAEATKASLQPRLPDAEYGSYEMARRLFDRVVRMSRDDLATKDRQRRARAQNLLRLVRAWLTSKSDLKLTDGLISIRSTAGKKDVGRLLRNASFPKLQDLSLIADLFEGERQNILSDRDKWRDLASARETELQTTNVKLRETSAERDRLSNELSSTQEELRQEKELRALDTTQQRGRMRTFLSERLSPSLSDARDALGFDPPLIEAAQQRIELAVKAIEDEVVKRHE